MTVRYACIKRRARPASTTSNMDAPDNYQTTHDIKTKIVVFDSLIFILSQFLPLLTTNGTIRYVLSPRRLRLSAHRTRNLMRVADFWDYETVH